MQSGRVIITMDTDWCPNFVLEYCLDFIADYPCTVFVTGRYAIDDSKNANVNIGIHPNFDRNEFITAAKIEEQISPLLDLYPASFCNRNHKLIWSSVFESVLPTLGISIDSSMQIHGMHSFQIDCPSKLKRFPINWSDGIYLSHKLEILDALHENSLNIISIHPIHLYLNTSSPKDYLSFKENVGTLEKASASTVEKYFEVGDKRPNGVRNEFSKLLHKKPKHYFTCLRNYK